MARDYALWQKSLAEGIGSAFLLMAIVGAGQLSTNLAEGAAAVPALHLLAISAAAGLCLKVFITTLGPISGGHFNGAVTAVMFAQGELVWQEAAAYCAAQLAGAFLGVWSVHAMFELPVMQVSTASTPAAHAWLAEAIATFGLLLVILLGEKLQPDSVPGNVGCFIAATHWYTSSGCFANPTVAIARAVTGTMTGIDGLGMLLFVVFELLGAAAAWALCRFGMLDPAGADTEACTPEKGPQAPKPLGLSAPKAEEQGKGVIADVGATPGVLDDCDTACVVATADSKDGEQRCRSLSVDLLGATTPSEPEVIKTRRNPSGVSPEGP